jgi:hypothetical protein
VFKLTLDKDYIVIERAQRLLGLMLSTRAENPSKSTKASSPFFRCLLVIFFVIASDKKM